MRFLVWAGAALACAVAVAPAEAAGKELGRPSIHERARIEAADGKRLWYHEEEFHRDPRLRATPHQTVILHLESAPRSRRMVEQAIPYVFPETATYKLCLPEKEPFLRRIELERDDGSEPALRVQRGQKCQTREVRAGLYHLRVHHDGGDVASDGAKAFVHLPKMQRAADAPAKAGRRSLAATAPAPAFFNCDARYVFSAPNGAFPTAVPGQPVQAVAAPVDTIWSSAWYVCPDANDNVAVVAITVEPNPDLMAMTASGPDGGDTRIYAREIPSDWSQARTFKLIDLGKGEFSLMAKFAGQLYPVVVDESGGLRWQATGTPTVFRTELRTYFETTLAPAPAYGEVIFEDDCYDNSLYWVFNSDVADFRRYTVFGVTLDEAIGSVFLSPDIPRIPVSLFPEADYGGFEQVFTQARTCLADSTLNYAVGSMKIRTLREFVASTNECQGCNLSGVNLSDLDLTGGNFQSSTFLGANLSGTVLQAARLDNANLGGADTMLTGTNFVSAFLECTSFGGADLSEAVVLDEGIKPIVKTDFSCRVDLTGARFRLDTFPLADWRYFDLTGARIDAIQGAAVSTAASPLDLSGAVLDQANFGSVILDHANLGCAATAKGPVCTRLVETNLTSASLQKANLANALLQGAGLKFANLDGANLCAAKLNQSPTSGVSANLQGAFLRNVNLAQGDLTGAVLQHADFYSTTTKTSCNPSAACDFVGQCASAVNAQMAFANLEKAYLAGVDFAGAGAQAANFAGAVLTGSHFTNVDLGQYAGAGSAANFTEAWLQGTTFSNAVVRGADFTSAVVDLANTKGKTFLAQLSVAENIAFPFYTPYAASTPGCVQFTTTAVTGLPGTDVTNFCPDGNPGPCTNAQWQTPRVPPVSLPASCSLATNDWNWILTN
jgi:uncharacterized protein YjbI with pentapeptide repeats